jgi:Zn-dependent oligopeptidase
VTDVDPAAHGLPDYPRLTVDDVRIATDEGLAAADAAVARAVSRWRSASSAGHPDPAAGTALLDGLSAALRTVWAAEGRGPVLAVVHPDPAVRAAADAATQRLEAWRASFVRDRRVLAALEEIDGAALDAEAAAVRDRWLATMRRSGAHLDDATRAELDRLQVRVAELQGRFVANQSAEGGGIVVERRRLAGLPAPTIDGLPPGDEPETVVVPVELRPSVLERVADRGVREAIQRRWLAIAGAANREVSAELRAVHRRMADLLGASSWADLRASAGMAGSLTAVRRFLDELEPPFLAARDRQLSAIRAPLAAEIGIDEAGLELQDWDVPRGLALLRDGLGADAAAIREFLPLPAVLDGLGRVVEAVFGVRLIEVPGTFGWHPDVLRYDCADTATGEGLGSLLLDLHARDGKMPGVAGVCMTLTVGGTAADGSREPTHTAIVTFVPRPEDGGPTLLAPTDIEALFHELGHALDFMLGRSRYAPIDGEAWIRDWSEAPSQLVGRWAGLPEVLSTLGRHVTTGEPLPVERAAAFARANAIGAALQELRLLWLARLDQALHGPDDIDLDEAWSVAWGIRGTAPVTAGYAASPLMVVNLGYDGVMYGFLWAQALLEEIVERFRQEGPLSPVVGAAYRRELLEPGWAADPRERMRSFLGRDPSVGPFLARIAT